ncbi:DNA polymerase III PolC-type-like [Homarus americanus]|uniref:DNA polymerase III PolC-type-like n=1 Tax=Homarus americanus TaxID=6706 RepID=A0A8J5JIL7_HOMAM|nr:DNA polymerase III PolC-type-like [Homarus americanus]XP_042240831.1 DNA polymerase III PolC-type-like [Homarus americanus]KAG7158697.1 DNA polymerase III PolC-type-like [Homarus americanus]
MKKDKKTMDKTNKSKLKEQHILGQCQSSHKRKVKDEEFPETKNVKRLRRGENVDLARQVLVTQSPEEIKSQPSDDSHEDVEAQKVLPVKQRPVLQAVLETLHTSQVFFDLETTSLRLDCDIIQIAAADKDATFNEFIIPKQPIHYMASNMTGITVINGVLTLRGKPLDAKTPAFALHNFLEWIKLRSPVLLYAHNASFDYQRFFHVIQKENLVEQFQQHIIGFVDTLGMFKTEYPGLNNYKQNTLVRKFLKKSYRCHSALEDATILQELYNTTFPHTISDFSCTFASAYEKWMYERKGKM